jgi:hypothetical protein
MARGEVDDLAGHLAGLNTLQLMGDCCNVPIPQERVPGLSVSMQRRRNRSKF